MKKDIFGLFMIMGVAFGLLSGQSVSIKLGMFHPSQDSDLWETNRENLIFDKTDMLASIVAAEYEYFLNRNLGLTIQGAYYKHEHYSSYRDYEYDDGTDIEQNLSLKVSSVELGLKYYPAGHRLTLIPYFGGGVGLYYWTYEQWGDFINFDEDTVSENEYAESNNYSLGFNARVGLINRFSRNMGWGVEAAYQWVKGDLGSAFEDFEPFDVGGFSVNLGLYFYL